MPKLTLIILDGFGINTANKEENAIALAHTPTFDALFNSQYAALNASGKAVGVPDGQMGNSEIGHLTIGAGRVARQSLVKISDLLESGAFEKLSAFGGAINHCRTNGSVLHLLSLFGPGGVHAIHSHLEGVLKIIPSDIQVRLHLFTDGRDLPPTSAHALMQAFEYEISKLPNVAIASIGGRYFGMDRDTNWERTQKAYNAFTKAENVTDFTPSEYIQFQYSVGKTDEFMDIASFSDDPSFTIRDGDAVIHMNYRADRAIQMTKAFVEPEKTPMKTLKYDQLFYVGMTKYYADMPCPVLIEDDSLVNTLGQVLSKNGKTQLRLAETEKFTHMTKFFDGAKNVELPGKTEILIASHKVPTFDMDPEMSADEIFETYTAKAKDFDFVGINFANGDIVGHTGSLTASMKAAEKLDEIIAKIIEFCANEGIELLITADHGNFEQMGTPDEPHNQHSLNPVPCWHIYDGEVQPIAEHGGLADIAPTCLHIMELPIPASMTGKVLVK